MRIATRFTSIVVLCVLIALAVASPADAQSDAPTCTGRPAASGLLAGTLESGGLMREYQVYVPTGYNPTRAVPLVLSLHGFASNMGQQRYFSGWDILGEAENFIAVFPNGTGRPLRWNAGEFSASERAGALMQAVIRAPSDDIQFLSDLLDSVETTYCIDSAHVYVTGLSNGGGMSNRVACELADRVTAIGTVGGAYPPLETCAPPRAVPVISFHGVLDPIVPFEGSEDMGLPGAETWASAWAARNDCASIATTDDPDYAVVSVMRWSDCADDADVILYEIADGGHTWPGSASFAEVMLGKTREDIPASAIMWTFFQRFSLP